MNIERKKIVAISAPRVINVDAKTGNTEECINVLFEGESRHKTYWSTAGGIFDILCMSQIGHEISIDVTAEGTILLLENHTLGIKEYM